MTDQAPLSELDKLESEFSARAGAAADPSAPAGDQLDQERPIDVDPGFREIVVTGSAIFLGIVCQRYRVNQVEPELAEKFGNALAEAIAYEGFGTKVDRRWRVWGAVGFAGFKIVSSRQPLAPPPPPAEPEGKQTETNKAEETNKQATVEPLPGVSAGQTYKGGDKAND